MLENKQYGVEYRYPGGYIYNNEVNHMVDDISDFAGSENQLEYYYGLLGKAGIDIKKYKQVDVSNLGGDTVFALISALIRKERFCSGLIEGLCEDGYLLKWLRRLKEIDEGEAVGSSKQNSVKDL